MDLDSQLTGSWGIRSPIARFVGVDEMVKKLTIPLRIRVLFVDIVLSCGWCWRASSEFE
jgi:hypothetical protein